jgi:hypothetical protein
LRAARNDDFVKYWPDEKDWFYTVEFWPADDPEVRAYTADIIGCLFAYAHLTNARSLTPLRDADAYELLFSFSFPYVSNPKPKFNTMSIEPRPG